MQKIMFPKAYKCIFCGKEILHDDGVYSTCNHCFETLPFRMGEYCILCGDDSVSGDICKRCKDLAPDFSAVYAPFSYSKEVSGVIVNYKDRPHKWLSTYIAKYLNDWYNTFHFKGEVITYVPSSSNSVKTRGFDHNKLVCEKLGVLIDKPVVGVLSCSNSMGKQKRNSSEIRALNVIGGFSLLKDIDLSCIANKDVILVDDVVTTGATVRECARILMNDGKAKSVRVLAFARR